MSARLLPLCLTLCDPMDCSPPVSSVHGIVQARILKLLPFSTPGALPNPGNEPPSPDSPSGGFFTSVQPGKPNSKPINTINMNGLNTPIRR